MTAPISSLKPGVLVETSAVRVSKAADVSRLVLRTRGALGPLNDALGVSLPQKIGNRDRTEGLEALCLGPDEWVLVGTPDGAAGILSRCGDVYESHPHSIVDISGRELTLEISGPKASTLLTMGCARDIDQIAPGTGRRTLFDGVTVVLWRDAPDRFRMDIWHSFVPHLMHLLDTGCKELAAETA
ncbi:sarcosine oxidase subunit gamma [Rhodobacteraceae bacterium]|nr:sarcosine oxidase subunit gamma [Paracoccaceae bacterium]